MLNDSNKPHPLKSEALRLVTWRGEGLAKMLDTTFDLSLPATQQTFDKFNQKWNFLFRQIIDPNSNRPTRRVIPHSTFGWNPLLQQVEDPVNIMGYGQTDFQHTCMTNTTLMPRDGKMALFGAGSQASLGIGCDIRHCDTKDERFVFDQDAFTDNDWWLGTDPQQLRFQERFRSQRINDLRINTRMESGSAEIREYNDILAGLNARSISMILVQPPINEKGTKRGSKEYYHERFNAIYRKLYVASVLDRHLPIIIFDAIKGVSEYSLQDQQEDLKLFLADNPQNEIANLLSIQNQALIDAKVIDDEHEPPTPPSPTIMDAISILQPNLVEQIKLHGDNNRLYAKILSTKKFFEGDTDDESLKSSMIIMNTLIKALEENNKKIAKLELEIQHLDANHELLMPLRQLIQTQKEIYARTSDKLLNKDYTYKLNYDTLEKSLATTNNTYLKSEGIAYSKDNNSKANGIDQLYADFSRRMSIFGGRYTDKTDSSYVLNSLERFESFVKDATSPKQFELIKQHYSQGPMLMAVAPLNSINLGDNLSIMQPELEDRRIFMYQDNGEIYLECTISRYPVKNDDRELVGYIDGPVKLTFKLTDTDFRIQEFATSSPLINDLYLGKEISRQQISRQITINPKAIELVADYKKATETYLKHLQKSSNPSALTMKKISIVEKLLKTLDKPDIGPSQQVKNFHERLAKGRDTLLKRTDGYFTAFIKSLGVVAGAILTLGVYAGTAYDRLLGKKATHGAAFVDEILTTAKKPKL